MGDTAFRWLALASGMLVLIILALIVLSTTNQARPAFTHMGLDFFTSTRWAPAEDRFGALDFIYGTALISVLALVLAVPVSLALAIFLSEIAAPRARSGVVYAIDLLAAVPSVVWGLWGFIVLRSPLQTFYGWLSDVLAPIPLIGRLFEGPVSGLSFATAGIVLALMITPIITSLSREVMDTVPLAQKEAAWALGATRWEMIRGAILPYSKGGIIGAVVLGLGRAMGETIAVALVIGSSAQITARLFASGDALPSQIANQFNESEGLFRSALIALGVTLFLFTIIVNLVARAIIVRSTRHLKGVAL
ncbi:MAG: phosphate ABC transporter permease subunit PstC [Acidimicrobiales bacterium]